MRCAAAAVVFGSGCPGSAGVRAAGMVDHGWSVGGDRLTAGPVAAVAVAGDAVLIASEVGATGAVGDVRRIGVDGATVWSRPLPARPRALAAGPTATGVATVVAIEGEIDGATLAAAGVLGLRDGLRGTPGAAVVRLGEDGAVRWSVSVGATHWAMVRALTLDGDQVVLGGAFAGTLRIGGRTETAAGGVDGFWARLDGDGHLLAIGRVGGDGFDAVTGVAALTDGRLAIGGTFTGTAELGDTDLASPKGDPVGGDGFVAVLDGAGALTWARTWGGLLEDTCAGVAALPDGEVAIAGTVSGEIDVAGRRMETAGPSDGLVAIFGVDGAVRGATLVGGVDVDTITAIVSTPGGGARGALGGRAVVAGRFSQTIATRRGLVAATGADAAFVAVVDREGVVVLAPIVTAAATVEAHLAADTTGWLVAAHADTLLTFGADPLPAGAAVWRRAW